MGFLIELDLWTRKIGRDAPGGEDLSPAKVIGVLVTSLVIAAVVFVVLTISGMSMLT